jgi:hypothetical protein
MRMHMHHHHHGGGGIYIAPGPGSIINIVVMYVVAALMFGTGAVFFVIGQATPILYTGFMIAAGTFVPVGIIMVVVAVAMGRRRANGQRLRASGVPGHAQIVGLTQTSMYVNNQPVVELQLQITTATHAPYMVTRRETVPLIMMGRLTSGHPLPVMVDPARPDNVVILWESALNVPAVVGGG